MDLRVDVPRMVASPRLRRPRPLGHEHVGHQLLEHAAAPARHDVQPGIGVRTLVHPDAEVFAPSPTGGIWGHVQSGGKVRQLWKCADAGICCFAMPRWVVMRVSETVVS